MNAPRTRPETAERRDAERRDAADLVSRAATAAGTVTTAARGIVEGFRAVAPDLGGPFAFVEVRLAGSVVEDHHHEGRTDPGFWREPLRRVADEAAAAGGPRHRTFRKSDDGRTIVLAAAPVPHDGRPAAGVLAAVMEVPGAELASTRAALLGLLAVAIGRNAGAAAAGPSGPGGPGGGPPVPALLADDGVPDDPDRLAIDLVNRLRARLDLVQVALGGVRGRRVRVLAVSGLDRVQERSPGVRTIREAMEECLDADRPLVAQRDAGWGEAARPADGHRLHARWNAQSGDPVASIPLRVGGETRAVLSVRSGGLVDADLLERLVVEAGAIPATIELVERASRGLARHAADRLRHEIRAFAVPSALVRRTIAAAGIVLALWVAFGSMNFAVTVPARLEPAVLRTSTAPFAGRLAEVLVEPGEVVAAGTPLFRLDDAEARLEVARLEAELASERAAAEAALAGGDVVESRLADARAAVVEARLEEARSRVASATVRSVEAGVVTEVDAAREVGRRLERGEAVLAVADLDAWQVELDVPQDRVRHLRAPASGVFAAHARPDEPLPLHLQRIGGGTVDRDGRRVLPATAGLDRAEAWLRPGMEGAVRIEVGRRAPWWVLSHRAVDAIRRGVGP